MHIINLLTIMEIIKNNKGGVKVCNEGYTHTHTKKCINKSAIRWECSQRRSQSCKGALVTDLQVIIFIYIYSECFN